MYTYATGMLQIEFQKAGNKQDSDNAKPKKRKKNSRDAKA